MKRIFFIGSLLIVCFVIVVAQDPIVIGKIGEEGELVYPSQAEEGPDGNIYVYDTMDAFFKVYSPEGNFLRKFGGEGQGPGEIQRTGGVRFGFMPNDKLYFTEFIGGHRWITIMELSGEFDKSIKIQISEVFGVMRAYPLQDGGFLLELSLSFTPEIKDDYFFYRVPRELVRIDTEGNVVSKIKRTNHITRISYSNDGADAPVPFPPEFRWIPYDKNTVLFSDGLSTKWNVYDYQGNLIKEINSPLPEPEKVTKEHLDEWRERWKENVSQDWYKRFGTVVDKYKKSIYEQMPNLDGLSLTPEGNILVSGEAEEGVEYVDYWLLDIKGKILIQGRTNTAGLHITRSFIFYGIMDKDGGFQFYAQKRTGSETQDLKKILK
ncbi:MAG: hypothetical protein JSV17_17740 [Candidatus Aminicenantes bacterium]|nr:MAG: hypothetical protein JSV17_17740 [Candidatus Aminicenantes bacterium]